MRDEPASQRAASETGDKKLVKRYLKGDEQAFDLLYQRYRQTVFSYLQGVMNNRSVAEELYQQTWIKVAANLCRYRHRDSFKAWILRIARNAAMDHFRREKRFVALDDKQLPSPDSTAASPRVEVDRQQTEEKLQQAINELPAEQKEVVLLRLQEMAFKEIARVQEVSINTVLGRMRYAILNLRDKMTGDLN